MPYELMHASGGGLLEELSLDRERKRKLLARVAELERTSEGVSGEAGRWERRAMRLEAQVGFGWFVLPEM